MEDPNQYLEGPSSTWKNHVRNIGVQMDKNIPIMVLPDTIWSFHVLTRILYLWQDEAPKKVLGSSFFFLECKYTIKLCDVTALFWIILNTIQHPNIITFGRPKVSVAAGAHKSFCQNQQWHNLVFNNKKSSCCLANSLVKHQQVHLFSTSNIASINIKQTGYLNE